MANYACTNEECTEYNLPKWGIAGTPASDVMCGGCGQMSLSETDETPPGDRPPYAPEPEAPPDE